LFVAYAVSIPKAVGKEINALAGSARENVLKAISHLESAPRPPGCVKLQGRDGWRIRVGDYRVIYDIQDEQLIVLLIRVAHRREAYQ